MINNLSSIGGSRISNINSANANHKHKLRRLIYDWLQQLLENDNVCRWFILSVIGHGAQSFDFEIYSLNGSPVVAAGPEAVKMVNFA